METNFGLLIITALFVGAASGYLGSIMVLKRMSLVGDAMSHVALPGMAIALTFGINPILGALTTLCLAVLGIWYLGEKSEIYPEALVGIFFTASLAIGILITPEPELLEALFGNIEKIGNWEAILTMLGAILIFIITQRIINRLLLGVVSEDLARSSGINMPRINLIYLLLVGLVVALGVKFVGTLLTGALVIVPAAAAKNLSVSVTKYHLLSVFIGAFSAVLGVTIAKSIGIQSGPAVVLVSILFFIVSYFFKKS